MDILLGVLAILLFLAMILLTVSLAHQSKFIESTAVAVCGSILLVGIVAKIIEHKPTESDIDDCQSQATWVDQNVGYNMVFKFKDGERYSYQSVIRIDGTESTEYRIEGRNECELYKKAIPIIKTYHEAQKQVEEEE